MISYKRPLLLLSRTTLRPGAARMISRAALSLEVARQGLPCEVRLPVAFFAAALT